MKIRSMSDVFVVGAIALATALIGGALLLVESHDVSHVHEEGEVDASERGPHGGRVLRDGDFALEVVVVENGASPELYVYASDKGDAVAPEQVQLNVTLTRLDGEVNVFRFVAAGEALKGLGIVEEPHSFDVAVTAAYRNKSYKWSYQNYEGRTVIAAATATGAGVETIAAGPATIVNRVTLMGRVTLDPGRSAHVHPRFAGLIREVRKTIGDAVQVGDVLAVIESNESLQPYQIRSPIAGRIIQRTATAGEVTGEEPLFEIADTSAVIAEFNVFPRQIPVVAEGQAARVRALEGDTYQDGVIAVLSPVADPLTQTITARIILENADGVWRPGTSVTAQVAVSAREVPLAVRNSALQTFNDSQVVYMKVGDTYEAYPLTLGETDGVHTEILGGLKAGADYVVKNSFLIKADIEKSGASHDH